MSSHHDESANAQRSDADRSSQLPELSEEGKKEIHRMAQAYEDRPTAVMPGSHRTVTGTAVNEWLDDEGNPKFSDEKDAPKTSDQPQAGTPRSRPGPD
jgi:hypothetical protein